MTDCGVFRLSDGNSCQCPWLSEVPEARHAMRGQIKSNDRCPQPLKVTSSEHDQSMGVKGKEQELPGFFWTFRKKLKAKKILAEKNSSKFSKNSRKSFKNSIICQLKTDFLLKKVPKLIYFAQKFAQT